MKIIKLEKGSKGEDFIKQIQENKKMRMEKYNIPPKILKKIEDKVQATALLNREGFDKQTFRLGMHIMYFMLKEENQLQ